MADAITLIDTFRRYAGLIERLLAGGLDFAAEAESASAVQVERGVVLPLSLRTSVLPADSPVERLIEITRSSERWARVAVIDRGGHHRPVYRPLLIFAWLEAFGNLYETLPRGEFGRWEESLRAWCDLLENELHEIGWDESSTMAVRGGATAEACWTALALHVAGKIFIRDAWTDLASDLFGKLTRGQQESGAYLRADASDNPETHWYHELVILHAAAAYAVRAEDRHVAGGVRRNTEFHLAETQPDHATGQPFGLFAFLWNAPTRGLADQLLHAVRTIRPGGPDGVAAILLADTLKSLRLFLSTG
jgi:hypothetical protein